mgnify:CR=1 FL=1
MTMRRKVNKVGTSTLTVSLPSKWAHAHGLARGDEVVLREEGNDLVISTEGGTRSATCEVDVSGYGPMVGRVVGALYKAGYDEFKLTFDDPSMAGRIEKELSKGFFGLDFLHRGKNHCILRAMASIRPDELDTSIRRLFKLIMENADEAVAALRDGRFDDLELVAQKDVNVNKFADFARRLLNKHGHPGVGQTSMVYFIVEELENVGDKYKYLAEYLARREHKPDEGVLEAFSLVRSFLEEFFELFYSFSAAAYRRFGDSYKSVRKKIEMRRREAKGEDLVVLVKLDSMVQAIFDLNGPLVTSHVA